MAWVALTACVVACSGNSDDSEGTDAAVDQTASDAPNDNSSAPPNDATTTDVTTPSDSGPLDASQDVQGDVPEIVDAPDDAPITTIDAGNTCTTNAQCGNKEYCAKTEGNCTGKGTCMPEPQNCPQFVKPVCGCDDKTYNNYCFANQKGVNLAYDGACE
jgi:hypothetical protein